MIDARLHEAVAHIGRHYGGRLLAVALFGSRARHRPRAESDWDLLLVVDDGERVRRTLYREWEGVVAPDVEHILPGISPHFARLPADDTAASSLWLEVATGHAILSDPTGRLSAWLARVQELIDAGRFQRRVVHGLPYWLSAV